MKKKFLRGKFTLSVLLIFSLAAGQAISNPASPRNTSLADNKYNKLYSSVTSSSVTSVKLNKNSTVIAKGYKDSLVPTILPSNATNKNVIWSSNNTKVATVDNKGVVTAVGTGTAIITVKTADKGKVAQCTVKVVTVSVSGIKFNKTSATISKGYNDVIVPTILPVNATNKSIIWSTSNSKVATVDSKGIVTAVSNGTCVITGKTADKGIVAKCTVKVVTVAVSGIKLNKATTSISKGNKEALLPTVSPANASNKSIIWATSNSKIATVDSKGVVTAVGIGSATITAKTADKGKIVSCKVNVVTPVSSVTLNKTATTLAKGYKETLYSTILPANAYFKNVSWSSSNINVATVDSKGVVTAKAVGTAVITVKSLDKSKIASCVVTVNDITAKYKPSNFKNEFIEINVVNSNKIKVTGKVIGGAKYILADLEAASTQNVIISKNLRADANGNFSFEMEHSLGSGTYRIDVSVGDKQFGTYNGFYYGIQLVKSSNVLYFPASKIYQNNIDKFKNQKIEAADKTVNVASDKDKKRILDLAIQITKGKTNNYDKLIAINDWVADNIYYDYDMYHGKAGFYDAIGTLDSKRSVCQGYSELTAALVRSLGIPCKIVAGYGNNNDTDWSNVPSGQNNHAWNEAYVDGRWVIIDTTWNSGNQYSNGNFYKGNIRHKYFDPTIENFSWDHRF